MYTVTGIQRGLRKYQNNFLYEFLQRIVAAPVKKNEIKGRGDFLIVKKKYCKYKKGLGNAHRCANHATPSIRKNWH
jgi:hypothetical protein